ncbi:hypothetical protein TSMEX_003713 [Taenia solium]|eukprot:TsM_001010100 transcript=TsM_001010100 gene=TsM_001010100
MHCNVSFGVVILEDLIHASPNGVELFRECAPTIDAVTGRHLRKLGLASVRHQNSKKVSLCVLYEPAKPRRWVRCDVQGTTLPLLHAAMEVVVAVLQLQSYITLNLATDRAP